MGSLPDVLELVATFVAALGWAGIGVLVLVETVFPPIPSEVVLAFAGVLALRGEVDPVAVTLAATAGSVGGAWLLHRLGAAVGVERVRRLADRLPLLDPSGIDRAVDAFVRRGRAAVFWGRFVPLVRSLVSIPAGAARMPMRPFLLLTTVGSLLWNAAWVAGGYALGANWERLLRIGDLLDLVLLALLVVVGVRLAWRRLTGARDATPDGEAGPAIDEHAVLEPSRT